MNKKIEYKEGYKGRGMCKHCFYSDYNEVLHENRCHYWCLNIRSAVYICKGIIKLKDTGIK